MRQCTTEDCEIGVELLEQSDLSARASAHLAMQAWTAFPCNRVAEGIADAERALALARATRDAHAEGLIRRDRCGAVRQQRAVRVVWVIPTGRAPTRFARTKRSAKPFLKLG